jgi:hypothetical protein
MFEKYQSKLSQSQETFPTTNTTPSETPTTNNDFYPFDELHPASPDLEMCLDIPQLAPQQRQAKTHQRRNNSDSIPPQGMTEDDLFIAVMPEVFRKGMDLDSLDDYLNQWDRLIDDMDNLQDQWDAITDLFEVLKRYYQEFTHDMKQFSDDADVQEIVEPLLSYSPSYSRCLQNLQFDTKTRATYSPRRHWSTVGKDGTGEITLFKLWSDIIPFIDTPFLFLLDSVYCVSGKSTSMFFLQAEVLMCHSTH